MGEEDGGDDNNDDVAFEICMRGSERDCHISREREREREGRH
jgi:hypothetical protein